MATVLIATLAFVAIGLFLTFLILSAKTRLVTSELCHIKINEDESLSFDIQGGDTLLSVLTGKDIPVPSPCGGKATCKQCKVQILEGAPEALDTDKGTFTPKELKSGWRLSCQCKVKQDLHLELPEAILSVKHLKGTVVSNKNVATFIKELVVDIPEEIDYRSGGYMQFYVPPFKTNTSDWKATMDPKYFSDWDRFEMFDRILDFSNLDEEVVRAYSMASYPAEKTRLLFNVRIATPPFKDGKLSNRIKWGICSSYIFSLKPGDEVTLSGPYGESFMINDERELVFLIGGAGSSFGRSHIMHLFKTESTKRKVTLWYGARALKENIYQKEYEALDKEAENFTYKLVLSEPSPEDLAAGWPKEDPEKTGFLFKAFEAGQLSKMKEPESALYYVCGPPMHNSSVLKLLDDYGVPPENIVLDDFGN